MKTGCFLAIVLVSATAGWGAATTPAILLHVYDLTGMRGADLTQAVGETERIFRAAGIDLAWTKGGVVSTEAHGLDGSIPDAPAGVRTVIAAAIVPSEGTEYPDGVLGRSRPRAVSGTQITIFLDAIRSHAMSAALPFPVLLGHALAHEVGHMMLRSGAGDHRHPGLMRAEWGPMEFDRIRHGALKFSQAQAAALRRSVAEPFGE